MKRYTITALLCLATKFLLAQTNELSMQDTRALPSIPSAYNGSAQLHFKAATAIGLSTSYYYTVLGLRGWVDDSGGKAHELAFGDENNVYLRSGFNTTGWGAWRSFLVSNENGNFSIGQSSIPTEKLTVNGNILLANRTNSYLISYASLSETFSGASTILGNNVVAGSSTNTVKKTRSIADAGSFVSLSYYHGITFHTAVTGELNIDQPVENSEKMRITQSGNVGIGTANPTEKLAVNGKIRAKEIKVEASNWPDYVFEEGYKVGTLEALESYIKANKHLPDMPTAKQIETSGLELGEVVKLQQKKIEELTLHLIEKDKQLQKSDQRLQDVEAKQKEMEILLKKLTEKK